MSDKSFTFFEFHFHDGVQLGPKSLDGLNSAGETAASDSEESEPALDAGNEAVEDPDESGGCLGCKLVGLGVLAAAAYAVRKLLGGPSGLDALDDIEEFDEFGDGGSENSEEAARADEGTADEGDGVAIEVTSGEEPDSGTNTGLLVAAAVTLLLLLAVGAKKLLDADVAEIEVPEELAEE